MSLVTEITDAAKNAVETVKDTVSSIAHRTNAETEHDSRVAAGDTLTPGEKLGSVATEGKESVLAEVDQAKADYRSEI